MMSNERRIENEKRIYRKLVSMLAERGWNLINVSDGEEIYLVTKVEEALEHVFAVDESWTYFTNGTKTHVVYIILGNGNDGYDMLSDHSLADDDDFEASIDTVYDWINEQEGA